RQVVALVQESIDDPVLPNFGTEMVARVLEARMVGGAIVPIPEVAAATEVREASGITQYRVAETGPLPVHGFAARSGPAADAAKEQILGFVEGAWEGDARILTPSGCPEGRCDFSEAP